MVTHPTRPAGIRIPRSDRAFYIASYVVLTLLFLSVLYPIVFVISASFSEWRMVSAGKVILWPVHPSVEGYAAVFRNRRVLLGFGNTLTYTLLGTLINVCVCMMCAYPLSRRDLPCRNVFMLIFAFTMYFGGGMIPNYLLMRNLGMLDTLWVMILPGALSVYNMILARTFMQTSIPGELLEADTLDGCSDLRYFLQIVLPLSTPIIATMALFYGVSNWNEYTTPLLYNSDDKLHTIQVVLQKMYNNSVQKIQNMDDLTSTTSSIATEAVRSATVVFATVPIIMVYPFLQKYFAKGVMVGSLKG